MITHRNILGLLAGYKNVTQDGPHRIGTTVSPFNFDNSVEEIFSTICFGGTLHIIHSEETSDGIYFGKYLIENKITTSYILPDFLTAVADSLKIFKDKLNLKCIITGLSPKKEHILQNFRDLDPDLIIINAYGPTEVTYGATAFNFEHTIIPDREVPIGIPIPNYQIYIVDNYLQPVPVGVTGEILIGGVGVSRGYFNKPALTAEKFIPDLFSGQNGSRLYRTGDLGKFQIDGNVEFLGRADHQVKIRGHRIELGEIESVICEHPGINKSVVITHEITPNDIRLVAYYEPKNKNITIKKSLRDYLAKQVPHYMIPNFFISMDEIPILSNGKIDRYSLPAPEIDEHILKNEYIEPQNDCELLLRSIWKTILCIERISVEDDFFELGGHSLMATQVVSRIRNFLGINLSLQTFFQKSTVRKLSEYILSMPSSVEIMTEITQFVRSVERDS